MLSFVHAVGVGSFFEKYVYLQYVWYFLGVLFVFALFVRLLNWSSLLKKEYIIKDFEFYGAELVVLRLMPKSNKIIIANIGQHFYLQSGKFKSEHPFTIMKQNKETGELTFGIRKVGGFWNEIVSKNVGESIYLDGPYGVFTLEGQNTNKKVIISGGVGVTPFVELAKYYGENAYYINCNRNISEAICRDEIKSNVKNYLDVFNDCENVTGVINGGMVKGFVTSDTIREFVGEDLLDINYFICGSPKYIEVVKSAVKSLGVKESRVYYEALGF